jgi:DNA-binding transcriptional regulator YiaG
MKDSKACRTSLDCGDHAIMKKATAAHPFHFLSSGLPNVYLTGMDYEECTRCHRITGIFPHVQDLLDTLKQLVLRKASPLTGDEIKYLRKSIGKSSGDFASWIGVTRDQISRWEHNRNSPEPPTDRAIRFLVADHYNGKQIAAIAEFNYEEKSAGIYLLRFDGKKWLGELSPRS